MNLITVENIIKTYHLGGADLQVLKGVSMAIQTGEMVALMGASGSGKTTLMNILGCLDRPTSGRYILDGEEISRMSANQRAVVRNSKIGFVFQNFNLLARTSALENVLLPTTYAENGVSAKVLQERAKTLLDRVGLGDRMHHEPSQLSGGQQQRVAIARSLVNNPRLVLADEPTGNLDSHTSEDVLQSFEKLNREEGITILLVTHDPTVAGHAQRIIHIRDGLIEAGAFASPPAATSGGTIPLPEPTTGKRR